MSTILNIRGTNGSGKSSVVRQLMEHFGVEADVAKPGTKRVWAYQLRNRMYVLGRYETACGGADTVSSFAKIKQQVSILAGHGDVVFEGVLWSGVFKSSDEFAHNSPHHVIFATLDTPAEVCIERVVARRKLAGNSKPFDPENLLAKHKSVVRAQEQLVKAGHDARILPHEEPLQTILRWLADLQPRSVETLKEDESAVSRS